MQTGAQIEAQQGIGSILTGRSSELWAVTLKGKSTATQQIYRRELAQFIKWLGLQDAESLYRMHLKSEKSKDSRDKGLVVQKLGEYLSYLQSAKSERTGKAYTWGKLAHARKALYSFFKASNVDLKSYGASESIRAITKPDVALHGKPDKDQLRRLIDHSPDARCRLLILMAKDSGLRISDVVALRYGDVKECTKNPELEFMAFYIKEKKTRVIAHPAIGPECIEGIRDWIVERREITGTEPLDSDYLIVQKKGGIVSKLAPASGSQVVGYQIRKNGFKTFTLHGIRKFNWTQLESGTIPYNWLCMLQGREIGNSSSAYSKPSDEEYLQKYIENYPRIALFDTPTPEQMQDQHMEEMDDLRGQVAEMKKAYEMMKGEYEKKFGVELVTFEPTSVFGKEESETEDQKLFREFMEWRKKAKAV